jgi:MFS family permease
VNALFAAGATFGALVQASLADWIGRRNAMLAAAICAGIGGALTAASVHIAMLITVRILQGFGLGLIICLVSLYLTEIAPARQRGLLASMTVCSLGAGYLV